jgi:hypothetical protein
VPASRRRPKKKKKKPKNTTQYKQNQTKSNMITEKTQRKGQKKAGEKVGKKTEYAGEMSKMVWVIVRDFNR